MWGLLFKFNSRKALEKKVKALDDIADYFGEKYAFYIAWLLHYTCWLIYPSLIGLLFYLIQISNYFRHDESYIEATDSILNPLYSLATAIWSTLFCESWKQKEAWLAGRWLVREFSDFSFDRKEFKSSLDFDILLHRSYKRSNPSKWKKWHS